MQHVHALASEKGVKAGQVALAWVLSKGVVPIPGTKRRSYLEENVAASDVELTVDEIARLEVAFAPGAAAGMRHPEEAMKDVGI